MAEMTVSIPWAAWYEDSEMMLSFPADWEVKLFAPQDAHDIGDEGVRRAFSEPIGTPTIVQMARGKRTAVVVTDDLTRPTPTHRLLPFVLHELNSSGISDENILVLLGIGAHRPMTREDMVKKLGSEVVKRLEIRNHNPFDHRTYLGVTSRGTPVHINSDFLAADLKICIGSILPHAGSGFSGGAKLVLPGVAGIECIRKNHGGGGGRLSGSLGRIEGNGLRADMEEVARMAGLDMAVNVVLTSRGEIAGCFVGDFVQAHRAGVGLARKVYATPVPNGWDVGVFNAYPKDSEFGQAGMAFNVWTSAQQPIVHETGTIVWCSAASEGLGFHALYGTGTRQLRQGNPLRGFGERRLIIFSPNITLFDLAPEARKDSVLCHTWEDVLAHLMNWHGSGTKVAVFPCGAIQLAESQEPKAEHSIPPANHPNECRG